MAKLGTLDPILTARFRQAETEARDALRDQNLPEAERLFEALSRNYSDRPSGFVGLAEVAGVAGDADRAARRWSVCLTRFPDSPPVSWRLSGGWASLRAKRFDEAGATFAALCRDYPDDYRAFIGVVYGAMHQHRWATALRAWGEIFARFPNRREPNWLISRAQCLVEVGEFEPAEAAYRQIISDYSDLVDGHRSFMSLLVRLGRLEEAGQAGERALECFPTNAGLLIQTTQIAIDSSDFPRARILLRSAAAVANGAQIETIFEKVSILFEGWERTSLWLELDRRLNSLVGGSKFADEMANAVMAMRLRLALRDHQGFLARLAEVPPDWNTVWLTKFRQLAEILRAPRFPNFGAEKIFGIGLSKTGTTSLTAALRILGFSASHWANEFTGEVLSLDDAYLFDALTDITTATMFETLYHLFPKSKFIYTVRPLEPWLISLSAMRRHRRVPSALDDLRVRMTTRGMVRYGTHHALAFGSIFYHHADDAAAYQAHDRRVRGFFAAHDSTRMLEYDITSGDGWEKLCRFLDCPIPDQAVPWKNRAPVLSLD